MRRTFGQLQNLTLDAISANSSSDTLASSDTISTRINEFINGRVHTAQAKLETFMGDTLPKTASTVEDQQYYHYPPDIRPPITSVTLEIGDVDYPLVVIHDQGEWDRINQIDFSGMTIPQYVFPRQRDFGIYPIPQSDGDTITIVADSLAKDMSADDYTTGTVSATQNDATITGSGTTFTAGMVGRWFKLTTNELWYMIDTHTSTTSIELETVYEDSSASGADYIIGESPDIPSEMHPFIPYGAAADYYALIEKDPSTAQAMNNYFWTGDFNNSKRGEDGDYVSGILGIANRYIGRDKGAIVYRNRHEVSRFNEVFASEISE